MQKFNKINSNKEGKVTSIHTHLVKYSEKICRSYVVALRPQHANGGASAELGALEPANAWLGANDSSGVGVGSAVGAAVGTPLGT